MPLTRSTKSRPDFQTRQARRPGRVRGIAGRLSSESTTMSSSIDASTAETPSTEDRIQTLTDLYNRLQALRQIPTLLLKPGPSINELSAPSSTVRPEFQNLKDIRELLKSDKVQEALRTARESEKKDKSELTPDFRRENRKRRYGI